MEMSLGYWDQAMLDYAKTLYFGQDSNSYSTLKSDKPRRFECIIMKKQYHTHHVIALNSLDGTTSENVFYIKGLSILIRIDNFVRKLEKCPTFGPIYLNFFLWKLCHVSDFRQTGP